MENHGFSMLQKRGISCKLSIIVAKNPHADADSGLLKGIILYCNAAFPPGFP